MDCCTSKKIKFEQCLLYIYCVFMPLGFVISTKYVNLLFICYFIVFLFNRISIQELKFGVLGKFMLCYLGYALLTVLWARNTGFAIGTLVSISQRCLLALCMYNTLEEEKEIEHIIFCLCISGFILVLFLVSNYGIYGIILYFNSMSRDRFAEEFTNVNAIAGILSITIITSWYWMFKKKRFGKILFIFQLLLFLLLLATGSRSAAISAVIGIILYTYFLTKSMRVLKIVIVVALFIIMYVFIKNMGWMPRMMNRFDEAIGFFQGNEITGSAKSRVEFAKYGLKKIVYNPIFGYGAGQFREYIGRDLGKDFSSHNNYIETLFSFGLIGFSFWYGMFIFCISKLYVKGNPLVYIVVVLLLTRLVSDLSGHSLSNTYPYCFIALGFVYIHLLKLRSNNDNGKRNIT